MIYLGVLLYGPGGNTILIMDKPKKFPSLREYLRTLETDEQHLFAKLCGTTLGNLRKHLSKGGKLGSDKVMAMAIKSGGLVKVTELRPDLPWDSIEPYLPINPEVAAAAACATTASSLA